MSLEMKDSSTKELMRLLHRIAVKRVMESFDAALRRAGITQRRLSEEAEMPPNAFSGTISEAEDPRLSTFLRYYCAALREMRSQGAEEKISIDSLIRESGAAGIIHLACQIERAGADVFSNPEAAALFVSLRQDVQMLNKKGAVSKEESAAFDKMYSLIKGGFRRE